MKREWKRVVLTLVLLFTAVFAVSASAKEVLLEASSFTGAWSTDRSEHTDIADFAYHIWIHRTNDLNKEKTIAFRVTESGTAKLNWRLMQGGSATHLGQYTVSVRLNGTEIRSYEFLTDATATGDKVYVEELGTVKPGDTIEYVVKEVKMGDWDYMYGRNSRPCGVEAVLEPFEAPVVTPEDVTVEEGQRATFTASAEGKEPSYQWYVDCSDGSGWVELEGETSATYTTAATVRGNDGYKYKCSAYGRDSNEAVLHVTFKPAPVPPVVTPEEATVEEGQRATFTASAEGTELTYQWYVDRGDGSGWAELEGEISATYVTGAATLANDGYRYKCCVSGIDSNEAELHVTFKPAPVPKTGDENRPMTWALLLGVSALGVLMLRKRTAR